MYSYADEVASVSEFRRVTGYHLDDGTREASSKFDNYLSLST